MWQCFCALLDAAAAAAAARGAKCLRCTRGCGTMPGTYRPALAVPSFSASTDRYYYYWVASGDIRSNFLPCDRERYSEVYGFFVANQDAAVGLVRDALCDRPALEHWRVSCGKAVLALRAK